MSQNRKMIEILLRAFPGILESEAIDMIANGTECAYPADKIICQEGAIEDLFYIILSGEVKVTKLIEGGNQRFLTTLKPGDFFGEMAIIHSAPRAATITTLTPLKALVFGQESFARLLENNKSMSLALIREVSRRLRENDEMAIVELRNKNTELAAAYEQLTRLEQARREFLTTIAHELRTPLMTASGFLQVVRMGSLQGEALGSALDTVSHNLQEIISLTNDILFVQEMDLILPEFQPTEVSTLVSEVVEGIKERAMHSGVHFLVNTPTGLPKIPAEPKSLARAFSAILDNAVKFSPNGGEIQINIHYNHQEITVQISDPGVGISAEALPHIFERFFHIDQVGEHLFRGAGLGLSIARQVIELHHGKIDVNSQPGKGTSFTIRLNAA